MKEMHIEDKASREMLEGRMLTAIFSHTANRSGLKAD
jgi:hypothetical protein